MTIIEKCKLEDCFDGSSVYRYTCDAIISKDAIYALQDLGELEYFHEFPRPFFRVIGKGGLQIKGVEGENNCRIVFPREDKEELSYAIEQVLRHITNFKGATHGSQNPEIL